MGDDDHRVRFARRLPLAREDLDAVDAFEASFSHGRISSFRLRVARSGGPIEDRGESAGRGTRRGASGKVVHCRPMTHGSHCPGPKWASALGARGGGDWGVIGATEREGVADWGAADARREPIPWETAPMPRTASTAARRRRRLPRCPAGERISVSSKVLMA